MNIVLVALDTSPAAEVVLETGLRVGDLTGAGVEVVHVLEGPEGTPAALEELTGRCGVPMTVLDGPVEPALTKAMERPEVIAGVIGARAKPFGFRSNGRTILEQAAVPVVVVPLDTVPHSAIRCLLVPLEGTESSSRPVLDRLLPLLATEVELVVLHSFTGETVPRMIDNPAYDLEILGKEFLTRHLPDADRIELGSGPVALRALEASERYRADLVVLSWSQDSSPERAQTVKQILATTELPVLLLPT